jgi:hypothetical protein
MYYKKPYILGIIKISISNASRDNYTTPLLCRIMGHLIEFTLRTVMRPILEVT